MGIFDSFKQALLSFARGVVDSVMNKITQQINEVMTKVTSPIRSFVSQVTGGIWRGKGADAFVAEINGVVLPGLTSMLTGFGNVNKSITRAGDILERADQAAASIASGLGDLFSKVF